MSRFTLRSSLRAACQTASRSFAIALLRPAPPLWTPHAWGIRLLVVVLLVAVLGSATRSPELVVLVEHPGTHGRLTEALHRLRGELVQHGFSVEVTTTDSPPGTLELERAADERGAVASVTMVNHSKDPEVLTRVDVWISDRVTGKTIKRTITPEASGEAAGILAIRTLDLLRSSLEEYEQRAEPPDIEGAHPERAASAVSDLSSPHPTAIFISAGAAFGVSFPDGGPSASPQLGAAYQVRRFGGRLLTLGPLLGPGPAVPEGSFEMVSLSVQMEPYFLPLKGERWQMEVFPSVGATFLQVRGSTAPPYTGQSDSTWILSTGGGMGGRLGIGPKVGLYLDARALMLLPQPVVSAGSVEVTLGTPLLTVGMGLSLQL